ncbi:MAG: hypothetical protein Q8N53_01100, partial [Longimicrobiales bacterium]|nr:hypothetical protein [Longimicrobiales bacterium]
LKAMVGEVAKASEQVGWVWCRFLPTALMMRLAPVKFNALVGDGRVASARLAQWTYSLDVLFQDQLDAAWAQGAILDVRALGGRPKELAK